jgi:hypothetical protein
MDLENDDYYSVARKRKGGSNHESQESCSFGTRKQRSCIAFSIKSCWKQQMLQE